MNTKSFFSVAQEIKIRATRKLAVSLVLTLSLIITQYWFAAQQAGAAGTDQLTLYQMVFNGQGDAAVQLVAEAARAMGNWQPAPGEKAVFDPSLAWSVRGEVMIRDLVPEECTNPKMAGVMSEECEADLVTKQNLVRFGMSMFYEPQPDGSTLPRSTFDDVLSTYIEEVGHSWQEYLFETDGLGSGPRTHLTRWDEVSRWGPGWEYQIKMYILDLDGTVLSLSDLERGRLKANICKTDGYANPLGHKVSIYGAPAGWPNPQGWPTTSPTSEEFQVFCAGVTA